MTTKRRCSFPDPLSLYISVPLYLSFSLDVVVVSAASFSSFSLIRFFYGRVRLRWALSRRARDSTGCLCSGIQWFMARAASTKRWIAAHTPDAERSCLCLRLISFRGMPYRAARIKLCITISYRLSHFSLIHSFTHRLIDTLELQHNSQRAASCIFFLSRKQRAFPVNWLAFSKAIAVRNCSFSLRACLCLYS